jgi:hypothetical protein
MECKGYSTTQYQGIPGFNEGILWRRAYLEGSLASSPPVSFPGWSKKFVCLLHVAAGREENRATAERPMTSEYHSTLNIPQQDFFGIISFHIIFSSSLTRACKSTIFLFIRVNGQCSRSSLHKPLINTFRCSIYARFKAALPSS